MQSLNSYSGIFQFRKLYVYWVEYILQFPPKANKSMDECLIFNSEQSSHKDVKIFTDMSSACVHNFNGLK